MKARVRQMEHELTQGPVVRSMLRFAVPMILGNLLQQCYNIADTVIVGHFLGSEALAAVGSAFTLMTFLTSILLGLAMGSGTVFSVRFGEKDHLGLREGVLASFVLLGIVTLVLNVLIFVGLDWIILALRTPSELVGLMRDYLRVIFAGLIGIFLYNFFASLLRSLARYLRVAAGLFGRLRRAEHRPGSVVCGGAAPGGGRGGGGQRSLPSTSPASALPSIPG